MKTLIAIAAVSLQFVCMVSGGWAQAYTRIVSPVQNQTVPGPDVKVQFEAGGMTLGPNAWNLHFKLDDEPFQVQFDGNHAHVFKNVKPGSHTVRVYAANGLHEAIAGTQSTVSFHVAYADGANYVNPGQPTLTYNLPQGEYLGVDAADVTVDFLLENATISPGGYQVAYYADGRRFLVQNRHSAQHLKNLNPGFHRIRMELQDANGDLVPGPFNSVEKTIVVTPDSTEKSQWPVPDGYEGQPRIDSIPGAMTAGGPRPVVQRVTPLTPDEISKQLSLTVNKSGETVRLNGQAAAPVAVTGEASTTGKSAVPASGTGEFEVREGGLPEETSVDLDAPVSSTAQKGTVEVHSAVDPDDELPEAEDSDIAGDEVDVDKISSGTIAVRRRADGSTSKMDTTPTLRLADKPGTQKSQAETTRTVLGKDTKSTASAVKATPAPKAKPADAATTSNTKTSTATATKASPEASAAKPSSQEAAPAASPSARSERGGDASRRRDRGARGSEGNQRDGSRASRDGNRAERRADRQSSEAPAAPSVPQAR